MITSIAAKTVLTTATRAAVAYAAITAIKERTTVPLAGLIKALSAATFARCYRP